MSDSAQFATPHSLGRVALVACLLGIFLGLHVALALMCVFGERQEPRWDLLWQWAAYGISLCTFHLLEFFITALFNPSVISSDSFLVNHSNAYTGANLFAATEFGFKFIFFPHFYNVWVSRVGIVLLLISQAVRSLAMITCGESFNHLIQTQKKDNHVLITHGIYKYLRHPSYVGFHYWSVGSQLVLNNPISTILFGYASWRFFRSRIPFEERSLMHHFPDEYAAYSRKARIMIPFIPSPIFEHAKST